MTPSRDDWAAIALVAFGNLKPTPKNWRSFWEGHLAHVDEPFGRLGVDESKMGELALAFRKEVLSHGRFPPMFEVEIEVAAKFLGANPRGRELERLDRQSRGLDCDLWDEGIDPQRWPRAKREEFLDLQINTVVRLRAICGARKGLSWRNVAIQLQREYATPERRLIWPSDTEVATLPVFSLGARLPTLKTFLDGLFVRAAVSGGWVRFGMCAVCDKFIFARKRGARRYCGGRCRKAASRKPKPSKEEREARLRATRDEYVAQGSSPFDALMRATAEVGDPEARPRRKKRKARV